MHWRRKYAFIQDFHYFHDDMVFLLDAAAHIVRERDKKSGKINA